MLLFSSGQWSRFGSICGRVVVLFVLVVAVVVVVVLFLCPLGRVFYRDECHFCFPLCRAFSPSL